jgi:hypothetical protein
MYMLYTLSKDSEGIIQKVHLCRKSYMYKLTKSKSRPQHEYKLDAYMYFTCMFVNNDYLFIEFVKSVEKYVQFLQK